MNNTRRWVNSLCRCIPERGLVTGSLSKCKSGLRQNVQLNVICAPVQETGFEKGCLYVICSWSWMHFVAAWTRIHIHCMCTCASDLSSVQMSDAVCSIMSMTFGAIACLMLFFFCFFLLLYLTVVATALTFRSWPEAPQMTSMTWSSF